MLCFGWAAVSAGSQPGKGFDYQKQLGVVDVDSAGQACLAIENATLAEEALVHLVSLDNPQTHIQARVHKKAEKTCSRDPNAGPTNSFYFLRLSGGTLAGDYIAIGIVDFDGPFSKNDDEVRADLNADGKSDAFRMCTSSEGLHITVWNGEPVGSERKWHRYYYLGYDVEPSCTEKDYAE